MSSDLLWRAAREGVHVVVGALLTGPGDDAQLWTAVCTTCTESWSELTAAQLNEITREHERLPPVEKGTGMANVRMVGDENDAERGAERREAGVRAAFSNAVDTAARVEARLAQLEDLLGPALIPVPHEPANVPAAQDKLDHRGVSELAANLAELHMHLERIADSMVDLIGRVDV